MASRHAWLLSVLLAAGCTTAVERQHDTDIGPEQLLSGQPLGFAELPAVPPAKQLLRLDPAMRRFLAEHVDPAASDRTRLSQLVEAIIGGGDFQLEYAADTRTAAETFHRRSGNCLSFTNLFVAMAREAGLHAAYQEVDVPPDWTRDGDTLTLNRHINVAVRVGSRRDHVVDFNIDDFHSSYARRRISDERALAHYYNNLGAERLLAGDLAGAFALIRAALADHDDGFSPAWDNLGSLYLRAGYPTYAEAAYRQALSVARWDFVAMSNLLRLYEQQGRLAEADALRERVRIHRLSNPYYRYELAREAFVGGQYEQAIRHLRFALRRKPDEPDFQSLLERAIASREN